MADETRRTLKSPRQRARRRPVRRRPSMGRRAALAAFVLALALCAAGVIARQLAPQGNTAQQRFDAIVVLGVPADKDGNPTPDQLSRVIEAVHEYERGVAPHIVMTGGPTTANFVEAQVMARTAEAQGVPPAAIVVEPAALNTIQNACYSTRLMKQRGWTSAEVVTSPAHLARSGLIFSRMPIAWRMHAAPGIAPPSATERAAKEAVEVAKTARYVLWAQWVDRCAP